jgi:hypothetical protein
LFGLYRQETGASSLDRTQYTAVLRVPPVESPQDAVKAAIAAQVKNGRKET